MRKALFPLFKWPQRCLTLWVKESKRPVEEAPLQHSTPQLEQQQLSTRILCGASSRTLNQERSQQCRELGTPLLLHSYELKTNSAPSVCNKGLFLLLKETSPREEIQNFIWSCKFCPMNLLKPTVNSWFFFKMPPLFASHIFYFTLK